MYEAGPANRVVIQHNGSFDNPDSQAAYQNNQIIDAAELISSHSGNPRFVPLEVWYNRIDSDVHTTDDNYDALLVDVEEHKIVGTLAPYDETDPDWRENRE